jgi:hypothetical protein
MGEWHLIDPEASFIVTLFSDCSPLLLSRLLPTWVGFGSSLYPLWVRFRLVGSSPEFSQ